MLIIITYDEKKEKEEDYQKRLLAIEMIKNNDLSNILLEELDSLNSINPKILKNGQDEMQNHKLVIMGIMRDNMHDILVMIKHIEYIGSFFKDYRVILFENDSTDGTKLALESWSKNNKKIKILSEDIGNRKRPSHKFMADIRNKYLDAINTIEYDDFDMVMVVDMDMSYGIDIRGMMDSFSKINQWDGVCSNGIANSQGKMYDAFAFRSDEFPFTVKQWQNICSQSNKNIKCNKDINFLKSIFAFRLGFQSDNRLYWLKIVPQIQKIYKPGSDLVPVSSCFGGMAIYKRAFMKNCKYDSIDNDCEHVFFNQCMKEKNRLRLVLNPSQTIRYSQYR